MDVAKSIFDEATTPEPVKVAVDHHSTTKPDGDMGIGIGAGETDGAEGKGIRKGNDLPVDKPGGEKDVIGLEEIRQLESVEANKSNDTTSDQQQSQSEQHRQLHQQQHQEKKQIVVVVRHGERMDEVDREWETTALRPFDPPLTSRGLAQAAMTGKTIAAIIGAALGDATATIRNDEAEIRVVSSPFLRCVQTAKQIARELGRPVAIDDGLSEWLKRGMFDQQPEPLTREQICSILNATSNGDEDAVVVIDDEGDDSETKKDGGDQEKEKDKETSSDELGRSESMKKKEESRLKSWFDPSHTSCHDFPKFPESVTSLYSRYAISVNELIKKYMPSASPHHPHEPSPPSHSPTSTPQSTKVTALVLVTHGYGVQSMCEALLEGSGNSIIDTPYCCVTHYARDSGADKWKLHLLCDASHLASLVDT